MPKSREKMHEGRHEEGGLGSVRAYAGGDGDARHRQHPVLRALVKARRSFRHSGVALAQARPRIPVPGSVSQDRPRMTDPTACVAAVAQMESSAIGATSNFTIRLWRRTAPACRRTV